MDEKRRSLEVKVGVFTLFGLLLTGVLAVYFGRAAEPFKEKYPLTVHFDNASGLLKNSQVLMGGARIGKVTTTPLIAQQQVGVIVTLEIYEHVRIPANSAFKVRSSGLLGDAYIDVQPEGGLAEAEEYLEPGALVEGDSSSGGIEGLAASGTELVEDLKKTNGELKRLLTRLNDEVVTSDFVDNLHDTAANAKSVTGDLDKNLGSITADLQETLGNLKEFSGQLETIGANAEETTANLKTSSGKLDDTLGSVDQAVSGIDEAVADLHALLEDARTGDGLLPTLVNDETLRGEVSDTIRNLRGLSANLKRHGILFYRDTAPETADTQTETETETAAATATAPAQDPASRRTWPSRRPGGARR